jgi:hypothetical protein
VPWIPAFPAAPLSPCGPATELPHTTLVKLSPENENNPVAYNVLNETATADDPPPVVFVAGTPLMEYRIDCPSYDTVNVGAVA